MGTSAEMNQMGPQKRCRAPFPNGRVPSGHDELFGKSHSAVLRILPIGIGQEKDIQPMDMNLFHKDDIRAGVKY
jgi:hypothetical protein